MAVKVRAYTRKSRSGKIVKVKEHSRKGSKKMSASKVTADGFKEIEPGFYVKRWDDGLNEKLGPGVEYKQKKENKKDKSPQLTDEQMAEMRKTWEKSHRRNVPQFVKDREQAQAATVKPQKKRKSFFDRINARLDRRLAKIDQQMEKYR